jgi:micrococcal nuclease
LVGGVTQNWHTVAALFFGLAVGGTAQADPAAVITPAPPVHVIDGDTVEVAGVRWRLDGIDAPEIGQARCPAERERGIRGAARLMQLLTERGGGHIVPTVTGRGTVASGGFGRKLGWLMFGDGTAWADVAVAEGHAVVWAYRATPRRPDWCAVPAS